jgi:putative tricarboxylic transport membrane protein
MKLQVIRNRVVYALAVAAICGLAACSHGAGNGSASDDAKMPSNVQFVVDTGPGGGSDVFARQIVKLLLQNKLIKGNWPVLSRPQGGGLAAMSFLKSKSPQPDYISAFTSKWVISGLSTANAEATLKDLTPIAELAEEQQMIAVPASSPYKTFADFIAAAKKNPGQLVQVGGAYSSVDNLLALKIQQNEGTSWKYLSFADGGPRITALLRGDAQMMVGAQTDFAEEVAAGQMKIIGVLGKARAPKFPDVPTLAEQGINLKGLPEQLQFRGIAGPPGMPPEAVAYYRDIFAKLVQTDDWKKYMEEEGDTTTFVTGDELKKQITDFTEDMTQLIELLKRSGK